MNADASGGRGGQSGSDEMDPTSLTAVPYIKVHAFCLSEITAAACGEASADRRLRRANFEIYMGDASSAQLFYQDNSTPDVLFIEFQGDVEQIKKDLVNLSAFCDEKTKVILLGDANDVVFYRWLMEMGISEYVVTPISSQQVVSSLSKLYAGSGKRIGRICAFISAKGGAGSSTIAHNCAWIASRMMASNVLLVDLDFAFGTATLNFNEDRRKAVAESICSSESGMDHLLLERLFLKYDEGVTLLAGQSSLNYSSYLDVQLCEKLLDLLSQATPYVFIDLPHLWAPWIKSILAASDDIIVVAEPDLANIRTAKELFELVESGRSNERPPRLVLNKVCTPKRPEISESEFCKVLGLESSSSINFDPESFCAAANEGKLLAQIKPDSKAAQQLVEITSILTGRKEIPKLPQKAPIVSRFLNKMNFGKN